MLEVAITAEYRGQIVRTVLPLECVQKQNPGTTVMEGVPSGGFPMPLPDGSVAIMRIFGVCEGAAGDGWSDIEESPRGHPLDANGNGQSVSWPIVWLSSPKNPSIIESYLSPQYYRAAGARIRPISAKVRLAETDPSSGTIRRQYAALAPFWSKYGSSGFWRQMRHYCGAAAVKIHAATDDASVGNSQTAGQELPEEWRAMRRLPITLAPFDFVRRHRFVDGDARLFDPLAEIVPMRLDGQALSWQPSATEPTGFVRLYRLPDGATKPTQFAYAGRQLELARFRQALPSEQAFLMIHNQCR